jgi:hypothetical protein
LLYIFPLKIGSPFSFTPVSNTKRKFESTKVACAMFASPPFTFYIQRKSGGGQGAFEIFIKKVYVEVEVFSTR